MTRPEAVHCRACCTCDQRAILVLVQQVGALPGSGTSAHRLAEPLHGLVALLPCRNGVVTRVRGTCRARPACAGPAGYYPGGPAFGHPSFAPAPSPAVWWLPPGLSRHGATKLADSGCGPWPLQGVPPPTPTARLRCRLPAQLLGGVLRKRRAAPAFTRLCGCRTGPSFDHDDDPPFPGHQHSVCFWFSR